MTSLRHNGPALRSEKENVLGRMADLAGPGGIGIKFQLLRRLGLEDHKFKAYLGHRVSLRSPWAT